MHGTLAGCDVVTCSPSPPRPLSPPAPPLRRTPRRRAATAGARPPPTAETAAPPRPTATRPTARSRRRPPRRAPPSRLLEGLSPREIAGQLVLVGIAAGSEIPTATFEEHHAGGIFLLQVWESAEQVDAVVDSALSLARPESPPLLAVDQEGGQVRMLAGRRGTGDGLGRDPRRRGSAGGGRRVHEHRRGPLRAGAHVALSPVADVVDPELGDANEPVGGLDRGFGTDPEQVADCVTTAVEALSEQGIGATLKHFPGLGRVEQNTDFSAEGIEDTTTGPEDPFLESFRAGIDAGARLVMMSSAIYPRIEPDVPAMFSAAAIQDLLRDGLGFEGLVVTDDIGAAQAVADVPVAERATRSLEAGGDAVLTADPSLTGELVDAIEEWAGRGEEQEQRVRESAGRMLALKEALGSL
ncbi:glycoside hydrolase family 3 N-terminal domain-containing protein [Brachybacterium sp. GPGPB12]|uniref:glycoside hydrolase family 3 N-terminal domain-containing protein n=1 Tax=Brachybacterium sp. GPGPB12 TaxID=3023517 RepID=UPI0031344971